MSAFLNTGDHVVITDCSYGGTNRAARLLFAEKYKVIAEIKKSFWRP